MSEMHSLFESSKGWSKWYQFKHMEKSAAVMSKLFNLLLTTVLTPYSEYSQSRVWPTVEENLGNKSITAP